VRSERPFDVPQLVQNTVGFIGRMILGFIRSGSGSLGASLDFPQFVQNTVGFIGKMILGFIGNSPRVHPQRLAGSFRSRRPVGFADRVIRSSFQRTSQGATLLIHHRSCRRRLPRDHSFTRNSSHFI
jgi:hypothetical protein